LAYFSLQNGVTQSSHSFSRVIQARASLDLAPGRLITGKINGKYSNVRWSQGNYAQLSLPERRSTNERSCVFDWRVAHALCDSYTGVQRRGYH